MNVAPTSLRLGFAGTPPFAVAALDALASSQHRVAAVFTQPDRPAGRGRTLHGSAVKQRAAELGIPVHQPRTFRAAEAVESLQMLELDAFVVAAYGLILPPAALTAARLGSFNIHASLLPRWRGAAPIQRAILAGDAETGITIMRMEAGLDTGPMLAMRRVPIDAVDTTGSLHDRLATVGGELIVATLDAVAAGTAREAAQPEAGITYANKLQKSEATIDWRDSAESVLRRIRAFNPWPVAQTQLRGMQLRIWNAELRNVAADSPAGTIVAATDEGVDIACSDRILRATRLQLAGRNALEARDFVRAQLLVGTRLSTP